VIETPEGTKTMFIKITIPAALSRFMRDDSGATAIEYAMIASGVGVAIAATVTSLGSGVKGLFTTVSTALK
jgi:pilus assembly protein Flp/PilA